MASDSFLKFKELCSRIVNRKTDSSGKKVEWLKISSLKFCKDRPFEMQFKYNIHGDYSYVNLKKRNKSLESFTCSVGELYPCGREISDKKFRDIKALLKYVPPVHHPFYDNLSRTSGNDAEVCDDIVDRDCEYTE